MAFAAGPHYTPEEGNGSGCRHGEPLDILFGGILSYGYLIRPLQGQTWLQLALRGGVLIGQPVVRYGLESVGPAGVDPKSYR